MTIICAVVQRITHKHLSLLIHEIFIHTLMVYYGIVNSKEYMVKMKVHTVFLDN